ncbi:MAG: response regulator [bacterium]
MDNPSAIPATHEVGAPSEIIRVLLVEDNPDDADILGEMLTESAFTQFELTLVERLDKALQHLTEERFDVVLLDLSLPDSWGLETFVRVHTQVPEVAVVVFTGLDDETIAVKAVHEGAQDYLIKGQVNSSLLVRAMRYAIERRRAENALANEKERLAVTLHSIGDGVMATDTKGKIVLINRVAENLTGWTQAEAIGRPLAEVFHIINEKTGQRCENLVEKILKTGRITGLANHTVLIAKDGGRRFLDDSGAPVRNKKGHIIGVVLVFRDITEKRKMEEELLRTKKLEAIGLLAGGIAHDFNNILTVILGNVSLARMYAKPEIDDRVLKKLAMVEKASLRAKNLSQQLLTFAKGGAPIKKVIFISKLLKETVDFTLSGANINCNFSVPEDLWLVECDEGQFSQVINNLILNAREAMPEGGTIEVKAENIIIEEGEKGLPLPDGKYIKLSFKDYGVGIKKEYLSKIFDPYFTTKQTGRGLGLSVASSIIKNHDGLITVESELGLGTTFYIYLPVSLKEMPATKPLKEKPSPGSQGRILLMDDEEDLRDTAAQMFEAIGYKVETASDGEEAIEMYKEAKSTGEGFDVVIMDLTIPGGMGGREAVKRLLQIDPDVHVIVSSGYSTDPIMADFRKYGFGGVLVKPFKINELSKILPHAA